MSTQLILYPQSYKGRFSSSSMGVFNEYIVNGRFFTGLNGTTLYNTNDPHPSRDAVSSSPPNSLGNWYRYTTTGAPWAAITAPAVTSGNLVLSYNALGGTGHTGVYQRLSGLIVGAQYDAVITIDTTSADGILTFETYSGTVLNSPSPSFVTNVSQITRTFTAQSTNDVFLIDYAVYGASGELIIRSISITESATSPTLIYSELQDGQVICDLYQEEDIPLSLSVDDFKNVAEQVKSYSKDFNLPATKRNNQIFNNMFEITRADDGLIFNPYAKTQCVLKEDGFILFEGYLRLIDVKDKDGEISYNVNLYSEVIALADTLKDRTFSDLDFSELEHDYNFGEILNSWEGQLTVAPLPISSFANNTGVAGATTTNVLKYPFIDWNHQFTVDGSGNPVLPNLESAFRPCIRLKYLINKIFAASGFNWTSNFFDGTVFNNLYMDFNWGADNAPNSFDVTGVGSYKSTAPENKATTSFAAIDISSSNFSAEFGFDTATNIFTCPAGQENTTYSFTYESVFRCYSATAQYTNFEARWLYTPSGATSIPIDPTPVIQMETSASATINVTGGSINLITIVDGGYYPLGTPTVTFTGGGSGENITVNMTGPAVSSITVIAGGNGHSPFATEIVFNSVNPLYTYSGGLTQILQPGDTLQLQMKASALDSIRQNDVPIFVVITSTKIMGSVSMTGVTNSVFLNTLRGELGQWDFLKGIMTMFNLVSMADETDPNNILIEPYADVFIKNTNSSTTSDMTLASRSIEHDWTDKIDASQMELKPLTDLNKNTIFQFVEDDDDHVFRVYKNSLSGHLYGSKELDATTSTNGMATVLHGEKEIIAEPFAATVSNPLMPQFSDFIIPSIYSTNDDGTSEGFDNAPRIFYSNYRKALSSCTYTVPAQNCGGCSATTQTDFLQFSHFTTIPSVSLTTTDFVFESQQLLPAVGTSPTDNLYSTYWQPYFNELYSPDTRTMTLKVNLTPADINTFKFYDTVFIKNRSFRVNKIEYKPNELATVEFILIP